RAARPDVGRPASAHQRPAGARPCPGQSPRPYPETRPGLGLPASRRRAALASPAPALRDRPMNPTISKPWDAYLTEADRAVLARGRFAQRMGFGTRPAIVVIDAQRYMVGERGVRNERYPSSCGEIGWAAVDRIAAILAAGRSIGVPIFLS